VTLEKDDRHIDNRFELKILNCSRKFIFRPPREEVKLDHGKRCLNDWLINLQMHIEASKGYKNFLPVPETVGSKEFWRVN
jgi:hypothetical protein